MKAIKFERELLYPLTDIAIVLAIVFFWLLFGLAQHARLFGLALLFLTLPAYLRFLLSLLDARANGRSALAPSIEMFNPADSLWTLTPMIHIAVAAWAGILLVKLDLPLFVMLFAAAYLVFVPASMAILAITHAPAESLNPLAIVRMIRACGFAYFVVPFILIGMSSMFVILYLAGVPLILIDLGTSYQIVLLFTMTGAVLHANDVAMQVAIPEPVDPTAEELAQALLKERQKVANHAYGFISRGNRHGGFAHIQQWIEKEAVPLEAHQWFFEEMLTGGNQEPAFFYAQDLMHLLLAARMDNEALKLIERCLYENSRWRPLPEDKAGVTELAQRHGREDLLALLQNWR
jgi:hypothetical protein